MSHVPDRMKKELWIVCFLREPVITPFSKCEHPAMLRIVMFEDMPFLYNTVPRCKPIFASGAPPKKPQLSQHWRKNWLCWAD